MDNSTGPRLWALLALLGVIGGCVSETPGVAQDGGPSGDAGDAGTIGRTDAGSTVGDAGQTAPDAGQPTLADVWAGRAHYVVDERFSPPPELRGHVETATGRLGDTYFMYYRSFTAGPAVLQISVATSTDGDRFTTHNGNQPVLRLGAPGASDALSLYAPSVIAHDGKLWMVYEGLPDGSRPQAVSAAWSSDGISWTKLGPVLQHADGWEAAGIGTPSLHWFNNQFYVFYHGFTGVDTRGCFGRGFASGPQLTALTKHGPPVLTADPAQLFLERGPGRGDILEEGGWYYMVLEGLAGSAHCGPARDGWGLARSRDLITWEYFSRNPIAWDPEGGCGEDMPSWQRIGDRNLVVVTKPSADGVRRYKPVWNACGKPEICNGVDDNCDGRIDEIDCSHKVVCKVFDDGFANPSGPSDALMSSNGKVCVPDGASGTCRRWWGQCETLPAADGHSHPVYFTVFGSNYLSTSLGAAAGFLGTDGTMCIPDGTPSGTCRMWSGSAYTGVAQGHAHRVLCSLFSPAYADLIGPTDAIYQGSNAFCMPGAGDACRSFFGRCFTQ